METPRNWRKEPSGSRQELDQHAERWKSTHHNWPPRSWGRRWCRRCTQPSPWTTTLRKCSGCRKGWSRHPSTQDRPSCSYGTHSSSRSSPRATRSTVET